MLADYIDSSVVFIALAGEDRRVRVEYFHDHGVIKRRPNIEMQERSRTMEVIRTGKVIWGNHPSIWADAIRIPLNLDRPETDDTMSAIFVPLKVGFETIGVLSVQSTDEGAYDESEVDLIAAIGRYLAVAVQNQRMVRVLQRAADTDLLTDLPNHSKLLRTLDELIAQATAEVPVACVLINVINFGIFNDTYGYQEGDRVLRSMAGGFSDLVRTFGEGVHAGRYGGDTFAVLISGRSGTQTGEIIAAIEKRCAALHYRAPTGFIPISVSIGSALAPQDARGRNELLTRATQRNRLSRKRGGGAVSADDIDTYRPHGSFEGIETIVESLLDRDPFTRQHVFHVNALAKRWASYNLHLSWEQLERLLQASLLHDVGKLLISDRILVKPGKLSPQEYRAVQFHAEFGRNILGRYDGYDEVAEIIGQHHERFDGAGYPQGLAGEHIHPCARAISILDAFSAMVLDRPYHRGVSDAEALAEIEACAGSQFDPDLAQRFLVFYRSGK